MFGLFGRKTAAIAEYNYSHGAQYKGITWSDDTLFLFLESPKKYIPGTKMVFAGLKREDDRTGTEISLSPNLRLCIIIQHISACIQTSFPDLCERSSRYSVYV